MVLPLFTFGHPAMGYFSLLTVIFHVSALVVSATPLVTNNANGVSYRGTSANGVEQFQSIFFGQPTSGERRFAPPQPYAPPNNTTIIATAPGAACPQIFAGNIFASAVTNVSEDCLSLRIARPAETSAADKLPVMVWFYGGKPCHLHIKLPHTKGFRLHRRTHIWTNLRPVIGPNRPCIASCSQRQTCHLCCCQFSY